MSSQAFYDHIEVHGLPLQSDTSDDQRAECCIRHQKAEIDMRYYARDADFFIPPTFERAHHYQWGRRFLIICKLEDQWEEPGSFLDVSFEALPPALDPNWPDEIGIPLPEVEVRPFSQRTIPNLVFMLEAMRMNIRRF